MHVNKFFVKSPGNFSLDNIVPANIGRLGKSKAKGMLQHDLGHMADLQERLYAERKQGLVIIFQGMDASGKDGTIKHVTSGLNPAGCQVTNFKAPTDIELDYDYLRRCQIALPRRGMMGIFNRSYYEEVLVVRVHKGILDSQRLQKQHCGRNLWEHRFRDIRNFETYLLSNGFRVLKFMLHVSFEEQARRFLERLEEKDKLWKFSNNDLKESKYWKRYTRVYEQVIRATSTPKAPWIVVPADKKWFARAVVARTIVKTLLEMNPKYPDPRTMSAGRHEALVEVKRRLRKHLGKKGR